MPRAALSLDWSARAALLMVLGWFGDDYWSAWVLLPAYAAAVAATVGAERALIGDVAPAASKATACGAYHMLSGLRTLRLAAVNGL